jgi:uncharacterized membrane protein YfcA
MVTLNATTSPVNALQTINNLTVVNGYALLSLGVLAFVWWIAYTRSKNRDQRGAIAAATFFTSLVAIGMTMLGLLPDEIIAGFIALTLISIYFLMER